MTRALLLTALLCNSFLVSFDERSAAFDVAVNRQAEKGWVFFGGAIFIMLLATGYALLERWRKRSFRKDKARNKKEKD